MGSSYITLGLVTISSIVVIIAAIPYILEIIRGKVKPRVVSWFVWTVLTVIAGCASFTDGQYTTAILMLCASITTMLVVVLGWQRGDRRIDRVDILCLIGASIGLVLWQLLQSPALAVIVMVGIDFIGGIPTLFHAWKRPYEELWFTFFLASVGSLCTLLAITEWKITSVVYPIFLALINAILAAIILLRQKKSDYGRFVRITKIIDHSMDDGIMIFKADETWADKYRLFCQRVYQATYTQPDLGVPAELFSVESFSTPETVKYFRSLFKDRVWLMIDANKNVIGGVAAVKTTDGYCMMKGLYIDPALQGKGYGKQLFGLVCEFAGNMPIKIEVIQYMTRTLELYKRWGFAVADMSLVSYPLRSWPTEALRAYQGVTMIRR